MKRFALSILCLILSVSGALALELRLKPRVVVPAAGEPVTLGQVVEGVNDPTLASMMIAPAPQAGETRRIGQREIERAIQRQRPELATIGFSGAARVNLIGDGQVVHAAQIERMLHQFLQQNRHRLPKAQLQLGDIRLPQDVIVPHGRLSHQVIPSDPEILGSNRFNVVLRVDGRVVENLTVRASLEALAPVVVAATDLSRGASLGAQDLQMVVLDISDLRDPCFSVDDLIGQRLKRGLKVGQPLVRTQVDFPPMVRRGQTVEIRLQRQGFVLTAKGEARQSGQQGDTIRVRNVASRRQLQGRIVAPGVVEVGI